MSDIHTSIISSNLNIKEFQVLNTIKLISEGATVPFISRYRKEMTGSLDEVAVLSIKEQYNKLLEVEKRREAIIKSIDEQNKLTTELRQKLESTWSLTELEDIYLPYKPKRKTKASIAREKGLEPLAAILMRQTESNIEAIALKYLNDQVKDTEEALEGARDIIAEWISENIRARNAIRKLFAHEAVISTKMVKGKETDGEKYKDYFEFGEQLKRCPSHRYLAMRRGEEEGFLKLSIEPDENKALEILDEIILKGNNPSTDQVSIAIKDSYKRLLAPSIENEYNAIYKEKADDEAIRVFAENLRQLLLASPLGQKRVMAIDPGFRTGCKLVCLDAQGKPVHNETIYPHPPQNETGIAMKKINTLVTSYKIQAIAIGNGTAGRETEHFIQKIKFDSDVQVFVVSENGASIYSASDIARKEFPEYDVTVRGAISIGRRLMDPLAELVKIDAKSIGVGQYQHDVDQKKLKESLDQVVESCVNRVGVNVNTASMHLLMYISGLGPQLAQNIVDYRSKNGPFESRKDLQKVARMGDKAFEQSAGFLRIPESKNPLDNSAVHPESYYIVDKIAKDLKVDISEMLKDEETRKKIDIKKYVSDKIGLPTLNDILQELSKPGRDPRGAVKVFEFDKNVHKIDDLIPGMELPGIVSNITNFGAFVDIGVKQDGLVHVSQLADRFVKDPNEVVKLHQHVRVKVLEVDASRKRIQLTMKL